jgi:hypothetical protein
LGELSATAGATQVSSVRVGRENANGRERYIAAAAGVVTEYRKPLILAG